MHPWLRYLEKVSKVVSESLASRLEDAATSPPFPETDVLRDGQVLIDFFDSQPARSNLSWCKRADPGSHPGRRDVLLDWLRYLTYL